MKVVYVSTLRTGGPISHLRYLLPHVAGAGVDVKVLCSSERVANLFRADAIDAEVAVLKSKYDVRGGWGLRSYLRSADIVHTHDRRAGLLARPLARATGAGVVHTYHGLPEPIAVQVGRPGVRRSPKTSRLRAAWLLHGYLGIESILAHLGAVIVPSQAMARFLGAHGIPAARIRVIPSGVDVRRKAGVPAHNPFVIGTVAILHHLKGVDLLVDACARIRHPIVLRIVGDGPLRPELEWQVRRLRIRAEFLGEVEDARDHIARFDLFVLPSRGENLPIAILEAMAAAVPVVATRVGGVPELLQDGQAGMIVEPEDASALAEAITSLMVDHERRARIAAAGAFRVEQQFEAGDVSRRLLKLYEDLAASPR